MSEVPRCRLAQGWDGELTNKAGFWRATSWFHFLHGRLGIALEKEFFIDNLLVRIHFIIEMIWRTGLAPWEFEFTFPDSLISTFLYR